MQYKNVKDKDVSDDFNNVPPLMKSQKSLAKVMQLIDKRSKSNTSAGKSRVWFYGSYPML